MHAKNSIGTLGTQVRQLAVPNFRLIEVTFEARFALSWHAHDWPGFCAVLGGTYVEQVARSMHDLGPLDLTFKPAGEPHRNDYREAGAHCLLLEVSPAWLAGVESRAGSSAYPFRYPRGSGELVARLRRELAMPDDVGTILIEGTCLELLASLWRLGGVREGASRPIWLNQARDILHDRWMERLELPDLAQIVDVHPVHLAQTFRRAFGCTVGEYLRGLRVNHAARDLRTSSKSIAHVATAHGFYDQSHFNRAFKRVIGWTPGQYRRLHA